MRQLASTAARCQSLTSGFASTSSTSARRRAEDPLLRQQGRALFGAGWLAAWPREPGDRAIARERYAASLAAAARAGDRQTTGWARSGMGMLASFDGAYATAATEYQASLALFREAGDRWGTNLALYWLGNAAAAQGHDRAARRFYDAALAQARQTGNPIGVARGLGGLGYLAWHAAQYAQSRRLLEESLAIRHEVGDRHVPRSRGPRRGACLAGAGAGVESGA